MRQRKHRHKNNLSNNRPNLRKMLINDNKIPVKKRNKEISSMLPCKRLKT